VIFSFKKNKFIGVGLYDPDSPIRIRVLHQGSPANIDASFFREKLTAAKAKRADLLATDTNGYRLLHGENDGFPGLVVDVYAGVAVLKLYSPVWFPWLDMLLPLIVEFAAAEAVVLRLARNVGTFGKLSGAADAGATNWDDGAVIHGTLADEEVIFREHGLQFVANVVKGHKTGFFLDHRANRKRIGELSQGREVLDISGPALAMARRNVALNFGEDTVHETLAEDAFAAMERLARAEQEFDIVIVDPPSFAKSDKEISGALAAYRKLHKLALPLVAPGGVLLAASCSARGVASNCWTKPSMTTTIRLGFRRGRT